MLVLLSVILTTSVLFPSITSTQIELVLGVGATLGLVAGILLLVQVRATARRMFPVTVEWQGSRYLADPADQHAG